MNCTGGQASQASEPSAALCIEQHGSYSMCCVAGQVQSINLRISNMKLHSGKKETTKHQG